MSHSRSDTPAARRRSSPGKKISKEIGFISDLGAESKELLPGDIVLWEAAFESLTWFNRGTMYVGGKRAGEYGNDVTTHVGIVIGRKVGDRIYTGSKPNGDEVEGFIDISGEEYTALRSEPDGPVMSHFTEGQSTISGLPDSKEDSDRKVEDVKDTEKKATSNRKWYMESVSKYSKRNGIIGRSFQVARPPQHTAQQQTLVELIVQDAANKGKWDDGKKIWSAARAARAPLFSQDSIIEMPADTYDDVNETNFICSGWVARLLDSAAAAARVDGQDAVSEEFRVDLALHCFPAELEDRLYRKLNFEFLVYPGTLSPDEPTVNPFAYLIGLIELELIRLRNDLEDPAKKGKHAKILKKYRDAYIKFEQIKIQIEVYQAARRGTPELLNNFEKAQLLLLEMKDFLAISTGKSGKSTSYANVVEGAKKVGLFIRDLGSDHLKALLAKVKSHDEFKVSSGPVIPWDEKNIPKVELRDPFHNIYSLVTREIMRLSKENSKEKNLTTKAERNALIVNLAEKCAKLKAIINDRYPNLVDPLRNKEAAEYFITGMQIAGLDNTIIGRVTVSTGIETNEPRWQSDIASLFNRQIKKTPPARPAMLTTGRFADPVEYLRILAREINELDWKQTELANHIRNLPVECKEDAFDSIISKIPALNILKARGAINFFVHKASFYEMFDWLLEKNINPHLSGIHSDPDTKRNIQKAYLKAVIDYMEIPTEKYKGYWDWVDEGREEKQLPQPVIPGEGKRTGPKPRSSSVPPPIARAGLDPLNWVKRKLPITTISSLTSPDYSIIERFVADKDNNSLQSYEELKYVMDRYLDQRMKGDTRNRSYTAWLKFWNPPPTKQNKENAVNAINLFFLGDKKNGIKPGNPRLITAEVLKAATDGKLKQILELAPDAIKKLEAARREAIAIEAMVNERRRAGFKYYYTP